MAHHTLIAVLTSLVLLFGGILMVVFVYLWLFWYVFRQESAVAAAEAAAAAERQLQSKRSGMSESDLEKLATVEFEPDQKDDEKEECAVCLDAFSPGERCRVMPLCKHRFHLFCADMWLCKHSFCPVCRRSTLVVEEEKEETNIADNDQLSVVIDITTESNNAEQQDVGAAVVS